MNVEFIVMPELGLATIRHIGPYNQIPAASIVSVPSPDQPGSSTARM